MAAATAPLPSTNCQKQDQRQYSIRWMLTTESLILFSALVIVTLAILSTYARRSRTIQYILTALSTLSLPIITYTINLADDTKSNISPLLFVSAIFLHLMYQRIAPSEGYNNVQDLHEASKVLTTQIVSLGWIGLLLVPNELKVPELKVPTCIALVLSLVKLVASYISVKLTSRSLAMGTKNSKLMIRSYMEHVLPPESSPPPANFTMSDFQFLVMGEDKQKIEASPDGLSVTVTKPEELITLDKIWTCDAKHLRDKERNKKVCLSFALFKMLRGEFEDNLPRPRPFSHEPGRGRARRLLLDGPFKSSDFREAQNVFGIIALELAFLNDYLFSTIPSIYYPWTPIFNIIFFFLLFFCNLVLIVTIVHRTVTQSSYLHVYYDSLAPQGSEKSYRVKALFTLDVSVCLILVVFPVFMDAWEIIAYMFSDWVRVALVCKYVQNPRQIWVQNALYPFCRFRRGILRTWSNKVYQHCLLKRITPRQRYILIPDEVKRAVFRSLKGCEGRRLTNGSTSLYRNGFKLHDLSEPYKLVGHTETILVWHIATFHCEEHKLNMINSRSTIENRKVASCLSKYCAYLLTRLPQLIPDEITWTRTIVREVVHEVRPKKKPCIFMRRRMDAVGGQSERARELVRMGNEIGYRLLSAEGESRRWKILAEFWAEVMLYLAASSDDVEAHKSCLANSGQFITHVWALLYHTTDQKDEIIQTRINDP